MFFLNKKWIYKLRTSGQRLARKSRAREKKNRPKVWYVGGTGRKWIKIHFQNSEARMRGIAKNGNPRSPMIYNGGGGEGGGSFEFCHVSEMPAGSYMMMDGSVPENGKAAAPSRLERQMWADIRIHFTLRLSLPLDYKSVIIIKKINFFYSIRKPVPQTWNLSKILQDHILGPKILHTKNAYMWTFFTHNKSA